MREKQIYTKKHLKKEKMTLSRGGVFQLGGSIPPPRRGVKRSLLTSPRSQTRQVRNILNIAQHVSDDSLWQLF